jgi:PEP-CTERM motif
MDKRIQAALHAAIATSLLVIGQAASAGIVNFTGSFSNDTPPPGINPGCAVNQVFVDFNPGNSTAAGTSNLGAFGPSQSHCINVPPAPYTGVFSFDFGARGNLIGTTSGFLTPTGTSGIFNSFVTYVASGGTGAFAGASGTINGIGTLNRNFARPLNTLALSGLLNAPGVPEPSSWALLIIGFGAIGGALRRRAGIVTASSVPA